MTSDVAIVPGGPPARQVLDRATALIGVGLFAVAAWPAAVGLVQLWGERPEYSHGFVMVPASVWLLWERRAVLCAVTLKPAFAGALVLAFGLAVLLAGTLLTWPVLGSYGLVLSVAGMVWSLGGWSMFRLVLPSIVTLALACPLPGRVQFAITWPLKHTASLLATGLLDVTGIDATLEGNLIYLQGLEELWIADACSGVHSLISLVALVVLGGLLFRPRLLLFAVLLVSCIPIAVLANALRIWLTGLVSVKVSAEAAQGVFHTLEGFGLFVVAGALLWAWALLLTRLWPGRAG